MSFHIGQKVVCINAGMKDARFTGFKLLRKGAIYTIRGISSGYTNGETGLHLEEIINPDQQRPDGSERGFDTSRFRPLLKRGTAIGMAILLRVADDASKRRNLIASLHD